MQYSEDDLLVIALLKALLNNIKRVEILLYMPLKETKF